MINTRTRPAAPGDAAQMTALLNKIILAGGTTAYQNPFEIAKMRAEIFDDPTMICCSVAITNGRLSGFQSLKLFGSDEQSGWASIASFVALDRSGMGIGRRLFSSTRQNASDAGVTYIDATIRADNVGGLKYYSGLGITDYAELPNLPLADGTLVTRIRKKLLL